MWTRGTELLAVLNTAVIYFIIILAPCGVLNLAETAPFSSRRSLSTSLAERLPKSPTPRTRLFPDVTSAPAGNTTQKIANDDPNIEVYAALIDAFEKLGLITPRQKTCYTVKKIIREVFSQDANKPQRTLGVYLYIQESVLAADPVYITGENGPVSGHSPDPAQASSSNTSSDSETEKELGCKSSPLIVITGAETMKDANASVVTNGNVSANSTGGMSAQSENDDHSGLSRTQVMVISTCSAVIGTFFLVAAIMRIRNYVKRKREGRMNNNQRPQCRGYSGGLRDSSSPIRGQNRSDSMSGSASPDRQIKSIGNSKDSVLYSRQSGDNSCEPLLSVISHGDEKPMLVITSASASNSPSSSGRGSQEEISAINRNQKEQDLDKSAEDEDDGRDIENKPLLSSLSDLGTNSDLQGVSFPYLDSSPIVQEANQKLESTCVDGIAPDVSIPSDLGDIVMSDPESGVVPEHDTVEENLGARGLAGLSQSDSSLSSSNNPSYRYGNQVEYISEYGDGCDSYFPPLSDEDFLQVTDTDDTSSNPAVFPERPPFIPQLDSFDSLSGVCFNPSDLNFDLEERKMTPIEELPPPPPELFRGSSLEDASPIVNGNNNPSPFTQHVVHDVVGNSRGTSDSQSIPLNNVLNQNCVETTGPDDENVDSPQFPDINTGKSCLDSGKSRTVTDGVGDAYSGDIQTMPVNSQLSSSDRTSLL